MNAPQYFVTDNGYKQLNCVAIFSTLSFVEIIAAKIPGYTASLHRFIQAQIDGYILIHIIPTS
jgi:hypothetical protein